MSIFIQIKKLIKIFIDYTIEGEYKVYTLKHTPFCIRRCYTGAYHQKYEGLAIVPNKIIVDNYMGNSFGCNSKYVVQKLLESGKDYDIVWTVKNPETVSRQFPNGVRLVEYGSPEAMQEYATAAVWLSNYQMVHYLNKGLLKKDGQCYIQMWHGSFGIKKIENNCDILRKDSNWLYLARRNSEYTDYWISNSRFETEVYREAFWDVSNVLEYGHPRNDVFFAGNRQEIRKKVCRKYGIEHKKLILYVPTFRDDFKYGQQGIDYDRMLNALSQRFGGQWALLLRMHPRMKKSMAAIPEGGIDMYEVTSYPDIQELLVAADAVITDYSSTIFDFLLTGRPAFIYADDYERYRNLRGLYYPLEETPFPLAADSTKLEQNILEFDEEDYRNRVEHFLREKGSVEDGHAGERVAELIERIIGK